MAKLIAFAASSYASPTKEYRSNDSDLTLNGDDFVFASAIVTESDWTLYDEVGFTGNSISLSPQGGPDNDGAFRDHADWGGATPFHVKSIQHS